MQFSLSNTEKLNKERYVGNLGMGKRFLSEDNHTLTGFNVFLDYDHYGNTRGSIGAEVKNAVMGLTSNYYKKRILRTKQINFRSKLNHFAFHLSNPFNVFFRNIFWSFHIF